jgi:hypothetical protein
LADVKGGFRASVAILNIDNTFPALSLCAAYAVFFPGAADAFATHPLGRTSCFTHLHFTFCACGVDGNLLLAHLPALDIERIQAHLRPTLLHQGRSFTLRDK